MLNLYPSYVAWHYYWLVVLVALGLVQAAASTVGLRGLQLGGRLWPRKAAFAGLGTAIAVGVIAFVLTTPDYLSPGLAGSELIVVFGAGAATAVVISGIGGLACRGPVRGDLAVAPEHALPVAGCSFDVLRCSAGGTELVVVISDPDLPPNMATPLARAITDSGRDCAVVYWERGSVPKYPDAVALVAMVLKALGSEPLDGAVAVVGLGIGGDVALRSAADDDRVGAVLAVGPALSGDGVLQGLPLLREMSFPSAWRWQRRWRRAGFVSALDSEAALGRLGNRGSVICSRDDGFFQPLGEVSVSAPGLEVVVGYSHERLLGEVAPGWVEERLVALREADAHHMG